MSKRKLNSTEVVAEVMAQETEKKPAKKKMTRFERHVFNKQWQTRDTTLAELQLTLREMKIAYVLWWNTAYEQQESDVALRPFVTGKIKTREKGESALAQARRGLMINAESIAHRLNMTRSAYSQLEESEKRRTLSLTKLEEAAAAMDCDLVYAIRPKELHSPTGANERHKTYSEQVWSELLEEACQDAWMLNCSQKRRGPALASVAARVTQKQIFLSRRMKPDS